MKYIQLPIAEDLEALWYGMPEEDRNRIEKMPSGIREAYLKLAHSYALSAYKLGGLRERQKSHKALQEVTAMFDPSRFPNDVFVRNPYVPQA